MKSFIRRLFGWAGGGDSRELPAASDQGDTADDPIAMLRDKIRADIANGFYDEDAILTNLPEYFDDEIDPALIRRDAPRLLRETLAEHAAREAEWPKVTDCDRLDAAFAALEADGVIARQNFTCCGTCGSTEIWDEIHTAQDAGLPARGYAFYHMQDTDSAVEGSGIYLGYGACEEGEEAALAIARDIIAELESQGLATHWDGSWSQRIGVTLDWKKRRGVATV
ncbi:hypothetical protein RZN05_12095 [Sphingomonas sp. HF-S4]|uniref:DUF6891 domain-containing protein n=1 Tax=Sphingomonas agrestis TaxID=3080540 RepID=A0ABU3Y8W0_9SPHN|nr:hypothetical protein [Sphingomonas sp. HF-S4]MDV3457727.1 hypothetical protein [Sphingomonas sp. HF-S4]